MRELPLETPAQVEVIGCRIAGVSVIETANEG